MRTATVLSCVTLALALGACGNDSSTTAPAPTPPATQTAMAATTAEADKLLSAVSDNIKANQWDLADKGMAQLEDMKPKLPAEYGPKIDQLKQTYDAAKAAAAKMPAMSMPK